MRKEKGTQGLIFIHSAPIIRLLKEVAANPEKYDAMIDANQALQDKDDSGGVPHIYAPPCVR